MMSEKILVTGANGFIGSALIELLLSHAKQVVALVRDNNINFPAGVRAAILPKTGTISSSIMHDVQSVVHCAARVHIMNDSSNDPLADFRRINVDFTLDLARKAAAAGVKRFVFLSSVKVNGEATIPGCPYQADDTPAPTDPYGISKMEAETGLKRIAEESGMEVVIIRPVLVYGPGVKANFRSMMIWLNRGFPLPLGDIRNKRSLVSLNNLVDLILVCLYHPKAANQIFMVSDGEDVSTTELLVRMGKALGKKAILIPISPALLNLGAALLGRKDMVIRLSGSLQVDIGKTRELLNWSPTESLDDGLRKAARDFK